mmetsp:Transcript_15177/g.44998  ORF Transcript_15177/g.44998 Transcript_15177/m.44998 type:complete len:204 (-) Transcript_15177:516-1127(-)
MQPRHMAAAWKAKPRLRKSSRSVCSMPDGSTARHSRSFAPRSLPQVAAGTRSVIGGSWKKSPHARSCTPPKAGTSDGREPRHSCSAPRPCLATRRRSCSSSRSRNSAESIDTSSMSSTSRPVASCLPLECDPPPPIRRSKSAWKVGTPTLLAEWSVVPPMCVAAMPVGAVIATAEEKRSAKTWRRKEMMTCVTCDLPTPPGPV